MIERLQPLLNDKSNISNLQFTPSIPILLAIAFLFPSTSSLSLFSPHIHNRSPIFLVNFLQASLSPRKWPLLPPQPPSLFSRPLPLLPPQLPPAPPPLFYVSQPTATLPLPHSVTASALLLPPAIPPSLSMSHPESDLSTLRALGPSSQWLRRASGISVRRN